MSRSSSDSSRSESSSSSSSNKPQLIREDGSSRSSPPRSEDQVENLSQSPLLADEEPWKLDIKNFQRNKKDDDELKKLKKQKSGRKLSKFYRKQNEIVALFEDMDKVGVEELTADELLAEAKREKAVGYKVKLAVYLSFGANMLLLGMKLYAAIATKSLSVIASLADSCLDIFAGIVILLTSYLMKKRNPYSYPAGKSRVEPLGILIFSCCMFTAAIQIITAGLEDFTAKDHNIDISLPTLIVISLTVVIKAGLFIYCRLLASVSETCKTLSIDHRNDVISNIVGMGCAITAAKKYWQFDPAGAIVIGLYIMITWFKNGKEQVMVLSGKTADSNFIRQITYLSWNHHKDIVAIDTVRAFHLSAGFLVEVDLVLPPEMVLKDAHDIGESLQKKLESLADVERAFVHLDYETEHRVGSEHAVKYPV